MQPAIEVINEDSEDDQSVDLDQQEQRIEEDEFRFAQVLDQPASELQRADTVSEEPVPEFKSEKEKNWWYQSKQIAKTVKAPQDFPKCLEKYLVTISPNKV